MQTIVQALARTEVPLHLCNVRSNTAAVQALSAGSVLMSPSAGFQVSASSELGRSFLHGCVADTYVLQCLQAMENANTRDYVTEKVYDALAAGCIPIYYGAPNVASYIPTPDAIVDMTNFDTVEELVAELERLAHNETAYMEKLAWKTQALEELSPSE